MSKESLEVRIHNIAIGALRCATGGGVIQEIGGVHYDSRSRPIEKAIGDLIEDLRPPKAPPVDGFYMSAADFRELEGVEGDLIRIRHKSAPAQINIHATLTKLQAVLNRSSCRKRSAERRRKA